MKTCQKISFFVLFLFCFSLFSSFHVSADGGGSAGVGVINVPPNYADINIYSVNDQIRVNLILSDYNSWMDIQKVQVNLEENGVVLYSFVFQQYSNPETFEKLNTFSEQSNSSLLVEEACYVSHSSSSETVSDRCQLEVRFVIKTTYFSQLHVISSDRAGDTTETFIEYKGSDMNRGDNTLLIPWVDGAIKVELPPFLLDISIFLIALIATVVIGKRTPFTRQLQQVFYESK